MEDEFALWRSLEEITVTQAAYLWCGLIPAEPHIIYVDRPETWRIKPQIAHMTFRKLHKAIDAGELQLSSYSGRKKLPTTYDGRSVDETPTRYVTMKELKRFALAIGEKPAFLFPSSEKKPKKPRPSSIHKDRCREIAKRAWADNPNMTIPDILFLDETIKACDGHVYSESAFRKWVKDLNPNPKPGRRPPTKLK